MTTTETASPVMTIDGASAVAETTFGVINPAIGDVFDQAPECTRQQLDAAMQGEGHEGTALRGGDEVDGLAPG